MPDLTMFFSSSLSRAVSIPTEPVPTVSFTIVSLPSVCEFFSTDLLIDNEVDVLSVLSTTWTFFT